MTSKASRWIDTGMLSCAIILTSLVLRREVSTPRRTDLRRPVAVSNWKTLQQGGNRIGPVDASLTIVELSDFQCPFCANFALRVLPAIRRLYPVDVAVIYRHWPLSIHEFAFDAAVASDCAARQGRFEAFHDALFRDQDYIGTRSFERFAMDAGVKDLAEFRRCRDAPEGMARVEADRAVALATKATGTPSFVVNGLLLRAPLDSARLDSIVRASRAK